MKLMYHGVIFVTVNKTVLGLQFMLRAGKAHMLEFRITIAAARAAQTVGW
jgi:hypothetical protein